jgi:chromosome segregation ATPase
LRSIKTRKNPDKNLLIEILQNSPKFTHARNIFQFWRYPHDMAFGIDKLGKKVEALEKSTGKLEYAMSSMSTELGEFKSATKNLTDQVKNLNASVDKLAQIFETQMKNLTESMQALGKNLTQNMVDNILNLPKMFSKKRDSSTSNSK